MSTTTDDGDDDGMREYVRELFGPRPDEADDEDRASAGDDEVRRYVHKLFTQAQAND